MSREHQLLLQLNATALALRLLQDATAELLVGTVHDGSLRSCGGASRNWGAWGPYRDFVQSGMGQKRERL